MRSVLRLFSGLVLFLVFSTQPALAKDYRLSILHTNDIHAAYAGFDQQGKPCKQGLCLDGNGGVARLKTLLNELRDSHTLVLDAGDQFTGTLFFTRFGSSIAADMVNSLGFDAAIPGNHEFDKGCEGFAEYVGMLKVPYLAANIDVPGIKLKPWTIVEKAGRNIGIIGLLTQDTPITSLPCAAAVFNPPDEALQRAVDELQAQGVNIIIALTHLGLDEDKRLAQKVDGVDVYVGGHSHSLLGAAPDSTVKAEGAYPVDFRTPSGEPVLVVTDWWSLHQLGRLNVAFDERGVITAWNGQPVLLNDEFKPDSAMQAKMDAYAAQLGDWLKADVGQIGIKDKKADEPLDGQDISICRRQECLSGSLTADAMLWATGADVALLNGGAVRNSLKNGTITEGDIMEALPFNNPLKKARVSGKTVREALEWGLSGVEKNSGRFLQVSGLRYGFNAAMPVGQRLGTVEIMDKNGWRALNDEESLELAVVEFMANGGDGYTMLGKCEWQTLPVDLNTALKDALRQGRGLNAPAMGRIASSR